ncbi:helix-turn-helix domain-containing protein [Nocardioides sp. KC13]|uniref:Helix-turn-helix domain-containing protein n=1 Tax=Nocardioides turkmenicus TaxID=2711220 RepID=A0A6M1R7Q2_9ACTN|nr:helix-turn-helix domain-containing protein [Nocardioides sp. KC13]
MPRPDRRAREALTDALRDARRAAGLTGAGLADALGSGWSQPKVSKIESGRQAVSEAEVRAWAAAVGADKEMLLALRARADQEQAAFRDARPADGAAEQHQEAYAAAEGAAKLLASFQPHSVPDLLQTPDYARALLALAGASRDDADQAEISAVVAARLRRSAILYEEGRSITLLVGEAALHHLVGSPDIMRAQIDHIARLATTTQATIGIVPLESFPVLVQHGWDQRDRIVTVETSVGDLEIADPVEVARYERWTQLLLEHALTGADAAERCARIISERRSPSRDIHE